MTPKERAVMQQALEALEGGLWDYGPGQDEHDKCNEVITTLREALAEQAEQEDKDLVAQMNIDVGLKQKVYEALAEQAEQERKYDELSSTHNWTPPNYTDEQWQKLDQEYQDHVAEQEPLGYVSQSVIDWLSSDERTEGAYSSINLYKNPCGSSDAPLYAAPVRTKDLTDDEIYTLYSEPCSDREMVEFARAVIAADREKNK